MACGETMRVGLVAPPGNVTLRCAFWHSTALVARRSRSQSQSSKSSTSYRKGSWWVLTAVLRLFARIY
jgi:hypothetical protein